MLRSYWLLAQVTVRLIPAQFPNVLGCAPVLVVTWMKQFAVVFPSGNGLLMVTLLEVEVIVVSVLFGFAVPPLAA
jgi:hypothetical protein